MDYIGSNQRAQRWAQKRREDIRDARHGRLSHVPAVGEGTRAHGQDAGAEATGQKSKDN